MASDIFLKYHALESLVSIGISGYLYRARLLFISQGLFGRENVNDNYFSLMWNLFYHNNLIDDEI